MQVAEKKAEHEKKIKIFVKWADEIRKKELVQFARKITQAEERQIDEEEIKKVKNTIKEFLEKHTDAKWWIENRDNIIKKIKESV